MLNRERLANLKHRKFSSFVVSKTCVGDFERYLSSRKPDEKISVPKLARI